ncbi:MAG TPA: hypothetical protein VGB37_01115 [Candidatus Lokiarchaeia archaeon]
MDYKKEISELKTELKDYDTSRTGYTANDKAGRTAKETAKIKRRICLLNAYEELLRIENLNKIEDTEKRENSDENRTPLSIDKEEVYKILLSWGGGSDGFKLIFKGEDLLRGVYFMSDWGEYEETELNEDEAEAVYNFYMYGDVSSFKE